MNSTQDSKPNWGTSYKLIAAEKWKAKNAAMGRDATEALVDYARPQAGMKVLDLASGTGEPSISLASRVEPQGHVTALDLSAELLQVAEQRARIEGSRISPPSRPTRTSCHFLTRASILRPPASASCSSPIPKRPCAKCTVCSDPKLGRAFCLGTF